jgi:hypothetical protein
MNTSRGSQDCSDYLSYTERDECRLIDGRCNRQTVVSLESCDGFSGHWPKNTIDRSVVVTGARQLFLNIDGHLVGRPSIVGVDWPVVHISHGRRITPCREPIARIPVIPAVVHEDDPVVVASPPTTIMPLPVVIAEGRIPLAAERVTTPVIRNPHIASTIIGGVTCPVDREVSIPIDRHLIAIAKLIRVASAINLGILCSVDHEVSLTINRYAVPNTRLVRIAMAINIVFRPINRDIPVAINRSATSRAKLLFSGQRFVPRDVPLANRARPVLVHRRIRVAAGRLVRRLSIHCSRMARSRRRTGVRRSCRMNVRCSMLRPRSLRLFVLRSPRCERQREASNAY